MDNNTQNADRSTLSIAITGSGGSGVVTTGQMLLQAVAKSGFYGLMTRSSGPQIRGGESAVMMRIGTGPVTCLDDRFDILLALDWLNVERFVDEIPLTGQSLIIYDPDAGEVPPSIACSQAEQMTIPLKQLSQSITGGRGNMIGLGVLGDLMDLPEQTLLEVVTRALGRKGEEVVNASRECVTAGYAESKSHQLDVHISPRQGEAPRWNISGNEASGLGAVMGGVRFVAAYPITPASEILEWLAPNLEKVGGSLLQAEDELASINMIIGASFGGVPSMTATSGPGLSLMMEGLGLAVTSETPVLVSNVMRGGPSTGIPTKSEQSDLNIALYGFHGDAPHIVLGALNIADCAFTTQWGVQLSERLQAVTIVLSDQSQGQARAIIDPPPEPAVVGERVTAEAGEQEYLRYRLTDDGISPMAVPGTPGCIYTADGLEHNQRGTPSSMSQDHIDQLDKRQRKLVDFDYGDDWAEIEGEGDTCLVTWGSSSGATFEAARRLTQLGRPTRAVAVRLLSPLPLEKLQQAMEGASTVLVVEQNHQGQFYNYLNATKVLAGDAMSLARPGPLPVRPNEIVSKIREGK
jgi:2-oxoglutarate ferredoxin oxidoreductase subunit alpha